MRLGLYGGSFDPIHEGHVRPVVKALSDLELDRVLYFPTASPPHKDSQRLAPFWNRYAMVELALLGHPRLQVSPFEMMRSGPAYTIDTLEFHAREYPQAELFLMLGYDSFLALHTWRRFEELPELAHLAVMIRSGGGSKGPVFIGSGSAREDPIEEDTAAKVSAPCDLEGEESADSVSGAPELHPVLAAARDRGRVHFLRNARVDVSSTEVRRILRTGETPADGWVKPSVLDYVRKYGLYGGKDSGALSH